MTDKKLLELAAKAVGIKSLDWRNGSQTFYYDDPETGREEWYPLSDKSQCLQMEIDLRFKILFDEDIKQWEVGFYQDDEYMFINDPDRQRASTMAAAEIGKGMK